MASPPLAFQGSSKGIATRRTARDSEFVWTTGLAVDQGPDLPVALAPHALQLVEKKMVEGLRFESRPGVNMVEHGKKLKRRKTPHLWLGISLTNLPCFFPEQLKAVGSQPRLALRWSGAALRQGSAGFRKCSAVCGKVQQGSVRVLRHGFASFQSAACCWGYT